MDFWRSRSVGALSEAKVEQVGGLFDFGMVDVGTGGAGSAHALPFIEDANVPYASIDEGGGDDARYPVEGFGVRARGSRLHGVDASEVLEGVPGAGANVTSGIDGEG